MKPRATKASKQLDAQIERLYYQHGQHVQIRLLDIPRIYRAGREAAANGADVEAAIVAAIAAARVA